MSLLESYREVVGSQTIDHLQQLSEPLKGMKAVHINSTRTGGGVAEILHRLIPLKRELGIDAEWDVITGDEAFYSCTKSFHNALQGFRVHLSENDLAAFEATNARNAEQLRAKLEAADIVFIHDPQPAPLLSLIPNRRGKWIWRCHIDVSRPQRSVWKYLRPYICPYDASIFSLSDFAQPLPHPEYLIPPSIDPLSEKNVEVSEKEIEQVRQEFGIDPERPLLTQVSRFDRFKDPIGVIQSFKLVQKYTPAQLVLAGGGATDDPEGEAVLREVREARGDDEDIKVLLLPSDAHRTINALQRASDIVLQKSTKEGFGLTVTEAMWKGKPVIGGATGGIRLQVIDHHTGFLVTTPEGAALRIRYLLHHREMMKQMGEKARAFVRDNFLLTRHLREYLTLMVAMLDGSTDRIQLR